MTRQTFDLIVEKLLNKKFPCNDKELTIDSVIDFIPEERSVNIPLAYAVVMAAENEQEYIIFETGEIQHADTGVVVGQKVLFGDDSE